MVAVEDGLWNDYKYVGTETIGGIEYVVIRTTMAKTLPLARPLCLPRSGLHGLARDHE